MLYEAQVLSAGGTRLFFSAEQADLFCLGWLAHLG
jgi:hypothetical protein